MHYIGFDIGGSRVKAALVKNKKIIELRTENLPNNFRGLLELTSKIVNDFVVSRRKGGPIKVGGIGFAVPGVIDPKREKVLRSPNIKYLNNRPLKKLLELKLRYSVKIEHDVHCFLLAEAAVGSAKRSRNIFYITLGTGLGGAWLYDNKIYFGAHGSAGEIGHAIMGLSIESGFNKFGIPSKIKGKSLKPEEVLDFEDLASNKIFKKLSGRNFKEIFRLAEEKDKKAEEIFKIMGRNLGLGLASLVNILDPEIIIIGGGISEASRFFLPSAKTVMRKYIISPLAKKEIKIVVNKLSHAGALGAALLFGRSKSSH